MDTSAAFFLVTVNIEESDIDDFDMGSISFYGITTCQCQTSFVCDDIPVTLEQNSVLGICLILSSPGVQFAEFDFSITGENGFKYFPITNDAGQELHFGTTIETQGTVKRITTQLITGLFDEGSAFAIVEGSGLLQFSQSRINMNETSDKDATREYDMSIILGASNPSSDSPSIFSLDFFCSTISSFFQPLKRFISTFF